MSQSAALGGPSVSDPFDVLGMAPHFDLEAAALEARHRELSRALHPDRYVGRPASERRLSLSKAIEVNEAFRELRDPVRRAEALLRRRGAELDEGREPPADPELLMEMMELREGLASARAEHDAAAVERLASLAREREAALLAALSAEFERAGAAELAPGRAEAIHARLGALRYYRRLLEEANATLDDLG